MRITMRKMGKRKGSRQADHHAVGESAAQQQLEWARQFETVFESSNLLASISGGPQWAEEVARTTIKMVNPQAD